MYIDLAMSTARMGIGRWARHLVRLRHVYFSLAAYARRSPVASVLTGDFRGGRYASADGDGREHRLAWEGETFVGAEYDDRDDPGLAHRMKGYLESLDPDLARLASACLSPTGAVPTAFLWSRLPREGSMAVIQQLRFYVCDEEKAIRQCARIAGPLPPACRAIALTAARSAWPFTLGVGEARAILALRGKVVPREEMRELRERLEAAGLTWSDAPVEPVRHAAMDRPSRRLLDAAAAGDPAAVVAALRDGAPPNGLARAGTIVGESPLVLAIKGDHLEVIEALLAGGADPEEGGQSFRPLAWAARRGNAKACELLLAAGALPRNPDRPDTILQHAAIGRDLAVVRLLADAGLRGVAPGFAERLEEMARSAGDEELLARLKGEAGGP